MHVPSSILKMSKKQLEDLLFRLHSYSFLKIYFQKEVH